MTPRMWNAIAEAFADLHLRLMKKSRIEKAQGVELAARTVCRTLRKRSVRFDGKRFMRIVLDRQ